MNSLWLFFHAFFERHHIKNGRGYEMNDTTSNQHPCKNAKSGYRNGEIIFVCNLTNKGCSAQYYCHEQKKWRPARNIKCENFEKRDISQNS